MSPQLVSVAGSEANAADNLRANSKLTAGEYCMPVLGVIFLPMNLPPTHPPLTPPSRGTIHRALLPSLEGLGVGSRVRFAYSDPWNLSPFEAARRNLAAKISG